jgi:hypothetical protein
VHPVDPLGVADARLVQQRGGVPSELCEPFHGS